MLDDGLDVAGSVLEGTAGEPSAAGLVPREADAVCEQDSRAAAGEAKRRCRPSGSCADDQDVEPLHEADRKHEARAGLQWPALAGVPEWPKGAGCKPAGSAFGGSNPPPCTPMRFSFRAGNDSELRLPPEQRDVLRRLEKGEITAEQAERELVGALLVVEQSSAEGKDAGQPASATESGKHKTEDEIAREMIERIAREIDEEARR